MDKIPQDIQKVITRLEQDYLIRSTAHNTTVIRNTRGQAINAYTEICGLHAKSLDGEVELKLEFYLQHKRQKNGIMKDVVILPDTNEANERVTRDLLEACA